MFSFILSGGAVWNMIIDVHKILLNGSKIRKFYNNRMVHNVNCPLLLHLNLPYLTYASI